MTLGLSRIKRRSAILIAGAAFALAACGNGINSTGAADIDRAADAALNFLYSTNPETLDLASKANGILIIPQITEASFMAGGSYGEGVLRIGDVPVDYYSATQATFGIQVGAQQYSQVLFFMTEAALSEFRSSPGFEGGADIKYASDNEGGTLGFNTTTVRSPVVAIIFAQAGAIIGATIEGTKYTRIIP